MISQFMGRLAKVERAPKSTRINEKHTRQTDGQTDRQTDGVTGVFHFNSILLHSDVRSGEVFDISAFRTRLFTSLSSSSLVRATTAC
jgi:hypothetical protein